jgi:rhodanese-related sulfurtransferase
MLAETDPIPHYLIDIRPEEQATTNPLPVELKQALHIPEDRVKDALSSSASWTRHLQGGHDGPVGPQTQQPAAYPTRDHLLVFLADDQSSMTKAAAAAAACGFERTATLAGGLQAFSEAARKQADLKYITRDAVAALLGQADINLAPDLATVLDIRRHDERSLYGTIPGTHHVPTDQLPAALQMEPEQWKRLYGFPKPQKEENIVMQCRTNRRAAWAAQLASDAGYGNCLVYRQGVYGWRLHSAVQVYSSYEKGDPPPEPEAFDVERVDANAAITDLTQLGLLQ